MISNSSVVALVSSHVRLLTHATCTRLNLTQSLSLGNERVFCNVVGDVCLGLNLTPSLFGGNKRVHSCNVVGNVSVVNDGRAMEVGCGGFDERSESMSCWRSALVANMQAWNASAGSSVVLLVSAVSD